MTSRCLPKEVSGDRSRLKGGHIGERPCASKEKLGPEGHKAARPPGNGQKGGEVGKSRARSAPMTDPMMVADLADPVAMMAVADADHDAGLGGRRSQHGKRKNGGDKGFHGFLQNG